MMPISRTASVNKNYQDPEGNGQAAAEDDEGDGEKHQAMEEAEQHREQENLKKRS